MRAKVDTEEIRKDRWALIVTEIPYQVNKSTMIEKIAEMVRDKRIEGISDIRDESDRSGMRVVIELKRDAVADVVLNQLYRFAAADVLSGNMVALNGGKPELMTLSTCSRHLCVPRRSHPAPNAYLLKKCATGPIFWSVWHRCRQHRRGHQADPQPRPIRRPPGASLMERNWPAQDVEALIRLIDDPRHMVQEDGTYKLSKNRPAPSSICGCSA
jgi:DNA gyrase subunit A